MYRVQDKERRKFYQNFFPRRLLYPLLALDCGAMELFESALLGLVQGITEFLPVSSSGHLWLMLEFWGMRSLSLEVVLHAGSLLAVIGFFWKDIVRIFKNMFRRGGDTLGWKLLFATLLTAPTGILVHNFFMQDMTVRIVGVTLLVTAGFILAAEWFRPKKERSFTWTLAALLGLVQGLAVLPGISRSGLTIAFLILVGLPRKQADENSFLLAIPTILGGLLFSLLDNQSDLVMFTQMSTWVGFFVSALAAVAAIAWMLKLVQGKWIWFAPYCALLGVLLLS